MQMTDGEGENQPTPDQPAEPAEGGGDDKEGGGEAPSGDGEEEKKD